VFENDAGLLFCGSVVAASEQDDRGRLLSGEREERSEVGVTRDDDPLFVACHVEEDVIVCVLQSALEGVDSVVARFAEQLSKSAVSGSGRRGTSSGGLQRYLAISDGIGSEAQRC
jgi:hypothetical protein